MRDEYVEILVKRILPETKKTKITVLSLTLLSFVMGIIFSVPIFYVTTVILLIIYYFKVMRMDCEYEYFYMDGVFDIAVIYNKSKRKNIISFTEGEIEIIAPANSHEIQRYNLSKIINCSEKHELDKQYIIVVRCKSEWKKIIIQMNDELLKALKKQIPMKIKV